MTLKYSWIDHTGARKSKYIHGIKLISPIFDYYKLVGFKIDGYELRVRNLNIDFVISAS